MGHLSVLITYLLHSKMTGMKRTFLVISTFGFFVLLISSCFEAAPGTANTFKTPTLPQEMFDYENVDVPHDVLFVFGNSIEGDFGNEGGFFVGDFAPTPSMKISNAGATLGRVLFYDKQLSLNNSVSCGSCHHQELSFADGLAKSAGFEGRRTSRNAMAIVNAGLNNNLFWDSRVQSTEDLISEPIQNHIEMGMEDLVALSSKLSKLEYYPNLFKNAFGDDAINEERIADAMSQFLNSMVSFDSKFDRESENNFAGFSTLEKAMHLSNLMAVRQKMVDPIPEAPQTLVWKWNIKMKAASRDSSKYRL